MRVRLLARMPSTAYSGGRLLALTMAEALAHAGAEVDFLVDCIPFMYQEFQSFSRVKLISADFDNLSPWVDTNVDAVIIVPGAFDVHAHGEFARHAIECRAKIALLNFESPNWFNAVSPFKKDAALWEGWDIISEYADMIMSISGEGNKHAKDYYVRCPKRCLFDFSYPGINTILADQARQPKVRKKQIVFLTRVDKHKGFDMLDPLVHRDLAGYAVMVFVGTGKVPPGTVERWKAKFDSVGMGFSLNAPIVGREKFALLKASALNYFPTRFEGFGIPPLEAGYCMLPCACSDLPVLREFGGDAFVYGDPSDPEDMRRAVLEALESTDRIAKGHRHLSNIARIENYGKRMMTMLGRLG